MALDKHELVDLTSATVLIFCGPEDFVAPDGSLHKVPTINLATKQERQ